MNESHRSDGVGNEYDRMYGEERLPVRMLARAAAAVALSVVVAVGVRTANFIKSTTTRHRALNERDISTDAPVVNTHLNKDTVE